MRFYFTTLQRPCFVSPLSFSFVGVWDAFFSVRIIITSFCRVTTLARHTAKGSKPLDLATKELWQELLGLFFSVRLVPKSLDTSLFSLLRQHEIVFLLAQQDTKTCRSVFLFFSKARTCRNFVLFSARYSLVKPRFFNEIFNKARYPRNFFRRFYSKTVEFLSLLQQGAHLLVEIFPAFQQDHSFAKPRFFNEIFN